MADAVAPTYRTPHGDAPPSAVDAEPAQAGEALTFRELLTSLNPLQHIPIIGTIYRAITGDTLPEASRRIGSFAVSGLMGGPIGMLTNLALLAIEKATGIDPEKAGQEILASIGIGSAATIAVASAGVSQDVGEWTDANDTMAAELVVPSAWSASQLLAYGVRTNDRGDLHRGDLRGSDVLNEMALVRYAA